MDRNDVLPLVNRHIMLYDDSEDNDRYPGVIKDFDLVEKGEEKPYRMIVAVSEVEAGKGRVVNNWTFAVSAEDIGKLLRKNLVTLARPVNIDGYDLVLYYPAVLVN